MLRKIKHVFGKGKIPEKLPPDVEKAVNELRKAKSRKKCLEKVYDMLTRKYRGFRFRTYTHLPELFVSDVGKLWGKSGFLHCTNMNYLLRLLLIQSGWFSEEDIQQKWTLVWYVSPHQYLRVRVSKKKYVNVDVWNNIYGVGLGDYARGFHGC